MLFDLFSFAGMGVVFTAILPLGECLTDY